MIKAIRKIAIIIMAMTMLIGTFALSGCDNVSLDKYKEKGKVKIDALVSTKTQSDYSTEKWTELLNVATEGKQAVESATNKVGVDTAVSAAKEEIDAVPAEVDMAEVLSQFDLTDPKIIWNGSIAEDFADDIILVTLRKTSTYPELQIKHFGLNNAESLEYVGGTRPPDYFFTAGYEKALANYRQIVFIHITPHGKDAVIEAIRELEKLDFVRSASPNNIDSGA